MQGRSIPPGKAATCSAGKKSGSRTAPPPPTGIHPFATNRKFSIPSVRSSSRAGAARPRRSLRSADHRDSVPRDPGARRWHGRISPGPCREPPARCTSGRSLSGFPRYDGTSPRGARAGVACDPWARLSKTTRSNSVSPRIGEPSKEAISTVSATELLLENLHGVRWRTTRKGASVRSPYSFVAVSGSISSANRFGAISVTGARWGVRRRLARLLAGPWRRSGSVFPVRRRGRPRQREVVFPTPLAGKERVFFARPGRSSSIGIRRFDDSGSPAATAEAGGGSPAGAVARPRFPEREAEELPARPSRCPHTGQRGIHASFSRMDISFRTDGRSRGTGRHRGHIYIPSRLLVVTSVFPLADDLPVEQRNRRTPGLPCQKFDHCRIRHEPLRDLVDREPLDDYARLLPSEDVLLEFRQGGIGARPAHSGRAAQRGLEYFQFSQDPPPCPEIPERVLCYKSIIDFACTLCQFVI